MAVSLKVSVRTVERDLSALQKLGIIRHEGKRNTGIWVILEQPGR
ncbi:MAG: HTH domain-containing protein [Bacteroidaceae bacterium]|nr:HTH domain-containing protein [Bacteroidaceae bacterium]